MKYSIITFLLSSHLYILASNADTSLFQPPVRFKFYYENSHNVYLEGGYFLGNYKGPSFSFNYDGIIKTYEYLIISLRIGAGYSFAKQKDSLLQQKIIFPMAVHFQLTKVNTQAGSFRRYNIKNIFQKIIMKTNIDIGLGAYNHANKQNLTPFVFLGARHQNPSGGLIYRLGCNIHLDNIIRKKSFKTAYYGPLLSVGWTF